MKCSLCGCWLLENTTAADCPVCAKRVGWVRPKTPPTMIPEPASIPLATLLPLFPDLPPDADAATVIERVRDGERARRAGPALQDVLDERARQDAKWGVQNHNPAVWAAILGEEVGEAVDTISRPETPHGDALQALVVAGRDCRIVLENRELLMQSAHLPGRGVSMYRAEMVQVAAVALAAVECLDRLAAMAAQEVTP